MRESQRIKARKGGFSLIEVTLAIGVVGFALVSLTALLPIGLESFHKAVDASVRSQIVQRIFNDALQTDFNTLIATAPADRYFDDQGNEVTQQNSIYQVRVQIMPETALPAAATNVNLATIQIKIANNPAHLVDSALFTTASKVPFSETSTFVARAN
jgi:uncharacterized protein (TIGR02598 family)